ncbi:MAG: DUF3224 domain-containing protein [Bacteroidetes bacterium]|jgi:catechol 2,3-dioxygenase-like lactoylglutathione lyase family enzyme|nr:DUF3224 domain-containing protein [Bacteroidota bacterium]
MITEINHLTLAVRDLEVSFRFYADVLGLRPVVRWEKGAYLTVGACWLALALDPHVRSEPLPESTHAAFGVAESDFDALVERLCTAGVERWKTNRSEGASFYFLDPDGHKLEIHVGSLTSRLSAFEKVPPPGLIRYPAAGETVPGVAAAPRQRSVAQLRVAPPARSFIEDMRTPPSSDHIMEKNAQGTFQITSWDETPLPDCDEGLNLTRASVQQTYAGAIDGKGSVEYLMKHRTDETATFVGYERITGAIDGRQGSFLLEHRGTFEGGVAASEWAIVPGSGTDDLAGITGQGTFRSAEHGRAEYEFTYAFE